MSGDASLRLNALLEEADLPGLEKALSARFEGYLALIQRWNRRINLTAIRDEEGILRRHFVESIVCARALPKGIATLLDFGSGAGFPGIPIALCRPEISVTLSESQGKKAAFLQEAARALEINVKVHAGCAEAGDHGFDCVTLRAVDRMKEAVVAARGLLNGNGWLAIMTSGSQLGELQAAAGEEFRWDSTVRLPFSDDRILILGSHRQR
jgi:16S rRNA (guanine527-N7)-methyltransferase